MVVSISPAVHRGDIDLADLLRGGLDQPETGAVAELHRLPGEGKGAGNDGLGGDDRRKGGEDDKGVERPARGQVIERLGRLSRPGEKQRSLAEVVEQQGREDECEPGQPDRAGAEMSHVRIEGFPAGHDQENRTEDPEGELAVFQEKAGSVKRVHCGEDLRSPQDAADAEQCNGGEPDQPSPVRTRPRPLPFPVSGKGRAQMRIRMVIGMTKPSRAGAATLSPSTALRTEMAGVITPSP